MNKYTVQMAGFEAPYEVEADDCTIGADFLKLYRIDEVGSCDNVAIFSTASIVSILIELDA